MCLRSNLPQLRFRWKGRIRNYQYLANVDLNMIKLPKFPIPTMPMIILSIHLSSIYSSSIICLSQSTTFITLTVLSHFVNQLPATAVQSGPILSRPGPSGGGGGSTFRRGSHVMIVCPAWSAKSMISPISSSAEQGIRLRCLIKKS